MIVFAICVVFALFLLIPRQNRENPVKLGFACALVFLSMYIEKGLTFIIGGLSETPFGEIASYHMTAVEFLIIVGIFAIGILIATILFKLVVVVKKDRDPGAYVPEDRAGLALKLTTEKGMFVDTVARDKDREDEDE